MKPMGTLYVVRELIFATRGTVPALGAGEFVVLLGRTGEENLSSRYRLYSFLTSRGNFTTHIDRNNFSVFFAEVG